MPANPEDLPETFQIEGLLCLHISDAESPGLGSIRSTKAWKRRTGGLKATEVEERVHGLDEVAVNGYGSRTRARAQIPQRLRVIYICIMGQEKTTESKSPYTILLHCLLHLS